jgi:two-component sensor histidine kinase
MLHMKLHILYTTLLLLIPAQSLLGSEPLVLNENLTQITAGKNFEYIEDKNRSLSIKNITDTSINWKKSENYILFFGFSGYSYWFRFTVKNNTADTMTWYLKTDKQYYDIIELYIPRKHGGFISKKTGDQREFKSRDVNCRYFTFLVKQEPGESTYYMKIENRGGISLLPRIFSPEEFINNLSHDLSTVWIFVGMLIVMLLYNFFLFLSSREKSYFYYLLCLLSFIYFAMVYNGLAFQYLWPTSPYWTNVSTRLSVSLVLLSNGLYFISYLDLKNRMPVSCRVMHVLVALSCICCIFSFTSFYRVTAIALAILIILFFMALFTISLLSALMKYRPAYYFLASSISFLLGGMIYALVLLKLLPAFSLSYWIFEGGIILFISIISFGIGDRLRIMKAELQKSNIDLEQKVKNRTAELHTANMELQKEVSERITAEDQLKKALEEKTILLQEIHHRVKNNLTIIHSLLNLQSESAENDTEKNLFQVAKNRVKSISMIHEKLYRSKSLSIINVKEYIEDLMDEMFETYSDITERIKLTTEIEDISININMAIPIAMLVNEIVTNSFKHAFPGGRRGEIKITFKKNSGGSYILSIGDNGISIPEDIDFF